MSSSFRGELWFSPTTQGSWTFGASQRARLGNKVCITPEKAPLNLDPIAPRVLVGIGGGYPGWLYALSEFLDWIDSIGEGTVTSTYELQPPEEEEDHLN